MISIRRCTGNTNTIPGKDQDEIETVRNLRLLEGLPEPLQKGRKTMKYNLREIMIRAWRNFRKNDDISFGEALHRSWISAKAEEVNAERIEKAKAGAGVSEEVNTWSGWKNLGREVMHGSKAIFGCDLIWGSRGDNAIYKARFFGMSQTQELATE